MTKLTKQNIYDFRKKFLELRDPIGFKFAEKYLSGYQELERVMKFSWFLEHWEEWQKELRAAIKSDALERIQEISVEGSAQSLNAAKYLANGEYLEDAPKRGRPSKAEVTGELKRNVKVIEELNEDYKRMTGLTVVQGGKS